MQIEEVVVWAEVGRSTMVPEVGWYHDKAWLWEV